MSYVGEPDIPYNRLQEMLGGLDRLIETVRELYRSGARFKVAATYHIRGFRDPGRV